MTYKKKASGPRYRASLLTAVVVAAAAVAVLWPAHRADDDIRPQTPAGSVLESGTVPAAAGNDAAPAAGAPGRLPAIRDLELAMEAALAEQSAAETAVLSAEAALLDVEEQLDLRVEQGEAPDDLEAEAELMLGGVFSRLQDALRRLDQADASVEMLQEELAVARSEQAVND